MSEIFSFFFFFTSSSLNQQNDFQRFRSLLLRRQKQLKILEFLAINFEKNAFTAARLISCRHYFFCVCLRGLKSLQKYCYEAIMCSAVIPLHKFSIKDFSSKDYQIRRKLRIWSHLLKKSLMENFIFCAVYDLCGKVLLISYINITKCFKIWCNERSWFLLIQSENASLFKTDINFKRQEPNLRLS